MPKPRCSRGCELVQVTERLWLCEHTAYGPACSRMGAVEEARRVMAEQGGYHAMLERERALEQPDVYVQAHLL